MSDETPKKHDDLKTSEDVVEKNEKQTKSGSWGAAIVGMIVIFIAIVISGQILPQIAPQTSGALGTIFYLVVASLVSVGAFAPSRVLESPKVARWIGTKNPKVARILCVITAIIFWVIIPRCLAWLKP